MGAELTGKKKILLIDLVLMAFSVWLAVGTHFYLTLVLMVVICVLLYMGNRVVKYIFVIFQGTRAVFSLIRLAEHLLGLASDSSLLYDLLYIVFAVISIVLIFKDKDIRAVFTK